ncbi:enoyl-CoA hydratase/carnithine racemase [Geomicrobium halophilum]|uniref:Enoyl-CoA hydratase/carnithine racemase n=1 Tax=Geomicrobium halophilum TaxID=549000 RepID=A0A841PZ68_9BACL|nr:enoyl-CoA hydratase [Geomicrobium halophilum]MBB6450153.1 enoyl-CoA hydratase/carnithine racemase [Geomicrobium halophilum]
MLEYVTVDTKDHIAVVTIHNPPLNVLSSAVFTELDETFQRLENDADTLAILITGKGEKAFVAGADIKEFPNLANSPNMKDAVMRTHRVMNRLESIPKPTIAVLNGLTLGGGCELALACDLRIAEQHAQVGLPEVKLGLFPGGGGTQRLPRLVGTAKAKELMYTGESIRAEEAKGVGLVNHVVPSGEGLKEASKLANKMTAHSLAAISRIKRAVDEGTERSLEDGIDHEAHLFVDVFQTEDMREGVQAFIEKRKPNYVHR